MSIRIATGLMLALCLPNAAAAQEAYLTQISVGAATISIPAQSSALDASAVLDTVRSLPDLPAAPSVDLSAYPLVPAPSGGAVANIVSNGDNNSASIVQTGTHAASIMQNGNWNNAMIGQTGTGNRASVYQLSSNATATISQSGANNRAMIVQR